MDARRALAIVCAAAAAALALGAGAAGADPTGGANHVVLVQATDDGVWAARGGTQVALAGGDTITSSNIAAATVACDGCHAAAVAVQVVLVTGSPAYFSPRNVAVAITGCNACGSYAYAWQYVLQTDRPVLLSAQARQKVAELRGEIADAATSILPSDRVTDPCFAAEGPPFPCETRDEQLDAKLDALTSELKATIDAGVAAAGADKLDAGIRRSVNS